MPPVALPDQAIMSGIRFHEGPGFSPAVALNQTIRSTLDVGPTTYYGLWIQTEGQGVGATGVAKIAVHHALSKIAIETNDNEILTVDPAAQLVHAAAMNTANVNQLSDWLYIPLARPGYTDSDWATGGLDSLKVAVTTRAALPANPDIGNAAQAACSLTKVRLWLQREELPAPATNGQLWTQRVINLGTPVQGHNILETLSLGDFDSLARLTILAPYKVSDFTQPTSGVYVDNLRLVHRGIEIYKASRAAAYAHMAALQRLNPSPNWGTDSAPQFSNAFPAILDPRNQKVDQRRLIAGGRRFPLRVEFDWPTNVTPAPLIAVAEGLTVPAGQTVVASA